MNVRQCRICDADINREFTFKEMMFGFRDEFAYGECSNCGCIQILDIPANIDKYYPPYYYSFNEKLPVLKRIPFFKRLFSTSRIKKKYARGKNHELEYLKPMLTLPNARILDIGCGKGVLIHALYNFGFEKVAGVDKYIPSEWDYGHGLKVFKKDLSELGTGVYDVLMMHHVLEHMDEQIKELTECFRILKKDGVLLIRIPVVNTAWDIYQNNWVQLDPPRHFVLHTIRSMGILAQKTGFVIDKTVFDSGAFQFWGSELYKNDTPLTLPETHEMRTGIMSFSAEQMDKFEKEARQLNADNKGDQAIFYFRKT
jgi:SAM-dependent methyltransferase